MLRQAASLKAKSLARSPSLATSSTRILKNMPTMAAVTMPRVSRHWKMPVPLPRLDAAKAIRQIQRNNHTNQAGADAL
jgi:hypothetical protein